MARRRNDAFVEAAAVLAALVFAGIAGVAGFVLGRETGDGGSAAPAAATGEEGGETGGTGEEGATGEGATTDEGATTGETGETTGGGETTGTGETDGDGEGGGGDAEAGQDVFASAGCGNCHALAAANASGNVGPSLDETNLDEEEIRAVVANGRGGMPAFEGQLSDEQIANVSAFVHESRE